MGEELKWSEQCKRYFFCLFEKIVFSGQIWETELCIKLNFYFLFIVETQKDGIFWTSNSLFFVKCIWTCLILTPGGNPHSLKKTLFVCHCVSCLQELMSLYRLLWYSDYGNRQKYYQVWIQLNRVHFPQQEWVKKNSLSIHSFRQMHYILLIKANKCTCSCYVEI